MLVNGQRVPLSATDPQQACLRQEWLALYQEHGGSVEEIVDTGIPAGSPVVPCQGLGALRVMVLFSPGREPVIGARVVAHGSSYVAGETDAAGAILFKNLPPGAYTIEASFTSPNPVVAAARKYIGNQDWALSEDRPPYPPGANKCNLFVTEVVTEAGRAAPWQSRFSLSRLATVEYPPLAGQWADPGIELGKWRVVSSPVPSGVVAEKINYSNATGHVGVVGDPLSGSSAATVVSAQRVSVAINLPLQTISAASSAVLNNDWGFRQGQLPVFRRWQP